jgi:hypothetical protein
MHEFFFKDPAVYPPPRGQKLLLLTRMGYTAIGMWFDEADNLGWHPLPQPENDMLKKIGKIDGHRS